MPNWKRIHKGKKREKTGKTSWRTLLRGVYFFPGVGVLYCGWFINPMLTLCIYRSCMYIYINIYIYIYPMDPWHSPPRLLVGASPPSSVALERRSTTSPPCSIRRPGDTWPSTRTRPDWQALAAWDEDGKFMEIHGGYSLCRDHSCIILHIYIYYILTCIYDSWKGGTECIGIVGQNGHPPVFATGTNRGILENDHYRTTGEWGTPRTLSSILQETSWIVDTAGDGR